ncbi:putative repeat protein (TIGR01451 family) [Fluviicoccus keumensis]|uniref:Putative repeat protein (TIGR01451 family) n=1 Tax=Fluviicoccus keumensis TaxID=1435465 RepID=A0A4Q7ZAV5_9GAMM|nr:DUF11 domain-containing protein [Fluviicoccus keumensis]RZU47727.1 putative repeat protein (TIGR01451 family) [Fluviicoccus keumensis]
MSNTTTRRAGPTRSPWRFNQLALSVAMVLGGVAALPGTAFAAAPNAGQSISNIATASYNDGSGTPRSATSNPVSTTVLQVASFTLDATQSKYVTLGGQVVYPHTLTNTGNGTDTFLLNATNQAGDNFNLGTLAIYADADGNGVADNATNLAGTTVSLPRNGVFTFVVVGYAPASGLLDGNTAVVHVTADSQVFNAVPADDPAVQTNVDTAIVTADAVINVTKSANVTQGPTGTQITYTLTYTNVGSNTATGVTLTDAIPAGATYVGGTGLWNGAGQTDGVDGDVFSITGSTVTASVGSVAPNVTGQIKFTVQVDATTPPSILTNTAKWTYDPDGAGVKTPIGPADTNDVQFQVLQTRNVGANDSSTINTDTGVNDIVEHGAVNQGSTFTFANEIWNQGNGTDSFNIDYSNLNFPAGTSIRLLKSDGVNQLVDTNGDFIVDTGPVAAGARYTVYLEVTLPGTASGNNGGLGYDILVTATSTASGTIVTAGDQDDTVTDHLDAITGSTVDLSNGPGLGVGTGVVNETNGGAAFTTKTVNPGSSATFRLDVNNTSPTADSYNFLADKDGTFGATDDLPSGWTVAYYADGGAGNCSTLGASSSNTGTLNAGASATYCAVVSVPAGNAPVTSQAIWFKTTSPTTLATDRKLDAVTVNTVRSLQITSNNSNTVYPGGTVDYVHIITNNGNVTEGDAVGEVVLSAANSTGAPNPWATQLFYDANNNGVLDVSEAATPITDLSTFVSGASAGLDAGESIRIFARVLSNASANPGDTDVATVTLTTTGTVNSVAAPAAVFNTDTTSVIGGQVRLTKTQALDANCDGTEDGGGFVLTTLSAKPGACIIYRISVQNQGVSPATGVVVSDATPSFTSLSVAGGRPSVSGAGNTITTPAAPANGYTGNVQATIPTLNGGASETVEIGVKIDN